MVTNQMIKYKDNLDKNSISTEQKFMTLHRNNIQTKWNQLGKTNQVDNILLPFPWEQKGDEF